MWLIIEGNIYFLQQKVFHFSYEKRVRFKQSNSFPMKLNILHYAVIKQLYKYRGYGQKFFNFIRCVVIGVSHKTVHQKCIS